MLEIADDGTGGADDAGDCLRVYVQHTNGERPHRALDLKPPDSRIRSTIATVSTPHAPQMNRAICSAV